MLWRITSVNVLPGMLSLAVGSAAAVKLRKQCPQTDGLELSLREAIEGHLRPRADFICDADGNVSQPSDLVAAKIQSSTPSVGIESIGSSLSGMATATATVTVVMGGAAVVADTASRVASATRDAANWVGDATVGAATRFRRQVTNAEATERLNQDVALRMTVLEQLAELKDMRVMLARMRAMFAVGMAIAAADGAISEEELAHIEEFVGGAAHAALPAELVGALELWRVAPPSIDEAFSIALECGSESMPFFDNVITVAIEADEYIHPAELEFKARWQALREANRA